MPCIWLKMKMDACLEGIFSRRQKLQPVYAWRACLLRAADLITG